MNGHDDAGMARAEAVKNWDDEPGAKEAWALMWYECDGCHHRERIWNARPHVTPFGGVPCTACEAQMTHVLFGSDVAAPDHRPKKGDLIFIDTPPELALIHARRIIDIHAGREDLGDPPTPEKLALSGLADFGGHPPSCIRLRS